jgi:hypothetical protein
MPRIKSLLNGEVSNVRGDIAREMVKLGVATALDALEAPNESPSKLPRYNPESVPEPQWEVVTTGVTQHELVIRMTLLGGVYHYSGSPENANRKISWDGGFRYANNFGREIPRQILAQYAAAWKSSPDLRGPEGCAEPERNGCPENVAMASMLAMREPNKGQ